MASINQLHVQNYHSAIESLHGHNMHVMHRNWHQNYRDPDPPRMRDPDWGIDIDFGSDFIQMHHEMLAALDTENKRHMMHQSISEWYRSEGLELPTDWSPLETIPSHLLYTPDSSAYPDEIRIPLEEHASSEGITVDQLLNRRTDRPNYSLPKYFTKDGVSRESDADPLTGAMKLADFVNLNQLGCSLVFPHNQWHGEIGGAMASTWTAIADPIFYWGVHLFVEKVFREYSEIQTARAAEPHGPIILSDRPAPLGETRPVSREFTAKESKLVAEFIESSKRFASPF